MYGIVQKLDEETAKKISQSNRNSNRASEIGWWEICPRFLVLIRTDTDKYPLHDVGLQRIFDEGKEQEKIVRHELENAHFELTDIQRDEKWRYLNISGHIDGKISLNGQSPILEIKSCSPNVFRTISGIQDAVELRDSKYSWIKKYYAQMQTYHLLFNEELGVILFKDKSSGAKHEIPSHIDYEYCERMCKVIEEVNDRVARNDPWPAEPKEACKSCGFAKTMCFPGRDYGPGFDFLSDEEIEAKLVRWDKLKDKAKEFQDLDSEIKEHFKGKCAIVGDFMIESKEFERKNYKVPDDVKNQYLEIGKYFRTSIQKL